MISFFSNHYEMISKVYLRLLNHLLALRSHVRFGETDILTTFLDRDNLFLFFIAAWFCLMNILIFHLNIQGVGIKWHINTCFIKDSFNS